MPGSEKRVDFPRLVAWVEGRLPDDEARVVEEQVARADSSTLADVAWIRKFVKATENAVLESPPLRLRDALLARFEAYNKGQGTPGFLQRVSARLAFDSALRPAVGLRDGGALRSRRQLIYSADAFDVALNLRTHVASKNLEIDGQFFPREDEELEPFGVQLLQEGTELALTVTDERGSFAFQSIPSGVYDIVFSTDQVEVAITRVALNV